MPRTHSNTYDNKNDDCYLFYAQNRKAMMHVPKQNRKKIDSKSKACIMVGYSETSKAYRLMDPESKQIHISRDVIFIENERCTTNEVNVGEMSNNNFVYVLDTVSTVQVTTENSMDSNLDPTEGSIDKSLASNRHLRQSNYDVGAELKDR